MQRKAATSRLSTDDASLCVVWPATSRAPRNVQAQHIPARQVSKQREKPRLLYKVIIGVPFGCFGRKVDGPGLPGGLIIYQGHLFNPKRTSMNSL